MEARRLGGRERISKAVYDTSVLMLAYQGVDVIGGVQEVLESNPECVVPLPVIRELERLASSGRLHARRAARLALEIVRSKCRIVECESPNADDAVIEYALRDPEAIVVTADKELRRRLREKGLPHVYYRAHKRGFELEG